MHGALVDWLLLVQDGTVVFRADPGKVFVAVGVGVGVEPANSQN